MHTFTPMLAEAADKEPTLVLVWSIAAFVSAACFLLCRWRRWALVLALCLAGLLIYATFSWLRDPNESSAIVSELGWSYVTQAWIAGFIPLLFIAAGCSLKRTRHAAA